MLEATQAKDEQVKSTSVVGKLPREKGTTIYLRVRLLGSNLHPVEASPWITTSLQALQDLKLGHDVGALV